MSPAVERALELANELRADAYDAGDDPILHAAADVAVHGIATASWLEDVKARMKARGIYVVELEEVMR